MVSDKLIFYQNVLGSRRLSNFFWAVVTITGGIGFLLAGLSSYLGINLLVVSDTSSLQYITMNLIRKLI